MLVKRTGSIFKEFAMPLKNYCKKTLRLKNLLKHLELPKGDKANTKIMKSKSKTEVVSKPIKDRVLKKTYLRKEVKKSELEEYVDKILSPKMTVTYFHEQHLKKTEVVPPCIRLDPYVIDSLNPKKTYYWCGCALSKTEPFCDGSHHDSIFKMTSFKVDDKNNKNIKLCGCRQTTKKPYCDDITCIRLKALEDGKKARGIIDNKQ